MSSQVSEVCKQFNPNTEQIYVKAWCQWFSFVRKHAPEFNAGEKGVEQRAFELLPALKVDDIIIHVCYSTQKRNMYWHNAYKLLHLKSDKYEHKSFEMCSLKETTEVIIREPFRTSKPRSDEWPHQDFVPLKWLNLPLEELSRILDELQYFIEHNAPLDLSVNWGRIRPKTRFKFTRTALQKLLERRYGIKDGKVKSTLGEICTYVVLQQLEGKHGGMADKVVEEFIGLAEQDALFLVEK